MYSELRPVRVILTQFVAGYSSTQVSFSGLADYCGGGLGRHDDTPPGMSLIDTLTVGVSFRTSATIS